MTAAEKIARCKTRLLLARPWWASLLLQLRVIEDLSVPTMCTDGERLIYNPAFVDSLPTEQVEGVLCHEVGHCALLHVARCGSRDPELWNIAADAAVNALLLADNIPLPSGHISPAPLDQTAEEIYALMLKKAKRLKLPMRDLMALASSSKAKTVERVWQRAVAQAAGLLPGTLRRSVDDAQKPQLPWQELLAQFVTAYARSGTRSWTRASRRVPNLIPGWQVEPVTEVAIVLDTSGSVSSSLLKTFIAECKSILGLNGMTAYVLAADAAVGCTIEPGQSFPKVLPGGGGTDFRPALKACEAREGVAAVIYLTDGAGRYPAGCTKPVLWALSERGVKSPFGQSIYLN